MEVKKQQINNEVLRVVQGEGGEAMEPYRELAEKLKAGGAGGAGVGDDEMKI